MELYGLKDKDGVDIYEGDIIEVKDHIQPSGFGFKCEDVKYEIVFKYGKWYGKKIIEDKTRYYYSEPLHDTYKYCEVVGSVFMNPELLQKGNG